MTYPYRGYGYNQTEAANLPMSVWTETSKIDTRGVYGDAQKAFESAYFHKTKDGLTQVGNVVKGLPYMSGRDGLGDYGLVLFSRRIDDVNRIEQVAKDKRDAKRAKAQAAKSTQDVITLSFDKQWNLTEKSTERRTVYKASTRLYIKTRSHGTPTVHEYKGKFYVVYGYNMAGRQVYQKVWNATLPALFDKHG